MGVTTGTVRGHLYSMDHLGQLRWSSYPSGPATLLGPKVAPTDPLVVDANGYTAAYAVGYETAAKEIREGYADRVQAKQRDLYTNSQDERIEWDRGYDAAVCAYRLGHDIDDMVRAGLYEPSLFAMPAVVDELLAGTNKRVRPDPRKT